MASPQGAVAVTRVELRRVAAAELVRRDEELSRSDWVRAMTSGSLDQLLAHATGKRFTNQVQLFAEGDAAPALFLVLRGEVRFLGRNTAGGDSVDFGGAARGELFGEDAIDSGARPYSAVAFGGEVDVLEIPVDAVRAVLGSEPGLQRLIDAMRARRGAARQEMCDFLGRW